MSAPHLKLSVNAADGISRVMNEQERKTVAYHESGHALVAALTPNGDPVSKISIIPRGVNRTPRAVRSINPTPCIRASGSAK